MVNIFADSRLFWFGLGVVRRTHRRTPRNAWERIRGEKCRASASSSGSGGLGDRCRSFLLICVCWRVFDASEARQLGSALTDAQIDARLLELDGMVWLFSLPLGVWYSQRALKLASMEQRLSKLREGAVLVSPQERDRAVQAYMRNRVSWPRSVCCVTCWCL